MRSLVTILVILSMALSGHSQNTKITDMTASGALSATDIIPVVVDPGGAKLNRRSTFTQVTTIVDATLSTSGTGNLVRVASPTFTGTVNGASLTLSGTLTIPQINDTNGNELVIFTTTASAVNELTFANAATGNNPTFTASGGDTNIGTTFVNKGSGTFKIRAGSTAYANSQEWLTSAGTVGAYMREDGMLALGTYGLATPGIYTTGLGLVALVGSYGGSNALVSYGIYVSERFGLASEAISGNAAAVSVSVPVSKYTSTAGGQTMTLANGTDGQIKVIVHVVDGGDSTLTPTTKTGYASINFATVGNTATLQYFTTIGWVIISVYGATVTP